MANINNIISNGRRIILALLKRARALLKASAVFVVLATAPLFLVFANTQIKELIDTFTGGCLFVIDKRLSADRVLVTARIAGTMPRLIPLMFQGQDASINTVLFDEPYRRGRIPEPDDLSFHPLTGSMCPGKLCPESGTDPARSRVLIMLGDLRPEFTYRFSVRLQPDDGKLDSHHLKIFAMFDSGLPDGVCKVQPRRWFNFWVWGTPLQKALLFLAIIVMGGLLLRWAKTPMEEKNE